MLLMLYVTLWVAAVVLMATGLSLVAAGLAAIAVFIVFRMELVWLAKTLQPAPGRRVTRA